MGEIVPFTPEKLIVGILCSRREYVARLENRLTQQFGSIDFKSDPIPFTFTSYYDREMGSSIQRYFISFERLISPDQLADCKLRTNRLEEEFMEGGQRRVNLDPGLLSLGKLILASTKDNAQRIPLADGIYAEITLIFRRKEYTALPWTYRDYQSDTYQSILLAIRDRYKRQLQTAGYL